jgi:hypothetical protein
MAIGTAGKVGLGVLAVYTAGVLYKYKQAADFRDKSLLGIPGIAPPAIRPIPWPSVLLWPVALIPFPGVNK